MNLNIRNNERKGKYSLKLNGDNVVSFGTRKKAKEREVEYVSSNFRLIGKKSNCVNSIFETWGEMGGFPFFLEAL